ncbi:putative arginine--tRNA ligase [Helianthus annuus]|nr:putative arginine--tRNA ligase [Helianthus annuus]
MAAPDTWMVVDHPKRLVVGLIWWWLKIRFHWGTLGGGAAGTFLNCDFVEAIMLNLPTSDMIESCSIAGPGFINVKLSTQENPEYAITDSIDTWAPELSVKRAIVDFSSPNITKEMHVGHLRSTIIGDTIARMLEYSKVDVLRRNHVGDWGTQFGMLIEFLFEKFQMGRLLIRILEN